MTLNKRKAAISGGVLVAIALAACFVWPGWVRHKIWGGSSEVVAEAPKVTLETLDAKLVAMATENAALKTDVAALKTALDSGVVKVELSDTGKTALGTHLAGLSLKCAPGASAAPAAGGICDLTAINAVLASVAADAKKAAEKPLVCGGGKGGGTCTANVDVQALAEQLGPLVNVSAPEGKGAGCNLTDTNGKLTALGSKVDGVSRTLATIADDARIAALKKVHCGDIIAPTGFSQARAPQ